MSLATTAAPRSTSPALPSISISRETSSGLFGIATMIGIMTMDERSTDDTIDQVLRILLLRPDHVDLLPRLALQHLDARAQ